MLARTRTSFVLIVTIPSCVPVGKSYLMNLRTANFKNFQTSCNKSRHIFVIYTYYKFAIFSVITASSRHIFIFRLSGIVKKIILDGMPG